MNKYLLAIAGPLCFLSLHSLAQPMKSNIPIWRNTPKSAMSAQKFVTEPWTISSKIGEKAEEKDADAYRITSVGTEGMGDIARGTAEIYKKK